jgi:hypothetical protein
MKYRIRILDVRFCGCDSEGEVRGALEDGREFRYYYQGSDHQAISRFPLNEVVDVKIIGKVSSATIASDCEKRLTFPDNNCRFEASGRVTNIESNDGELLYVLDSVVPLVFDNELGQFPISIDSCVNVKGELWAEDWWE